MSCVSNNTMGPRRSRSAFSLLELLVAMMVTMIFVGAVYTTFLQISRGHQAAEARMDALRNGRAALSNISEELKTANTRGAKTQYHFVGTPLKLTNGDGRDNDGDGLIDEEAVNGILDAPTSGTTADLDRHALLGGTLKERPNWVGVSDLGDAQVDVDATFGHDVLTYQIFPSGAVAPELDYKLITYEVKDFDGQSNVLVRRAELHYNNGTPTAVAESPLAFNVAGFDLLYWNPVDYGLPSFPVGWNTSWDTDILKNIVGVQLYLPASVYIRLTLLADPRPAASVQALRTANPDAPIDVITLESVVNIEETIKDGKYPRA